MSTNIASWFVVKLQRNCQQLRYCKHVVYDQAVSLQRSEAMLFKIGLRKRVSGEWSIQYVVGGT